MQLCTKGWRHGEPNPVLPTLGIFSETNVQISENLQSTVSSIILRSFQKTCFRERFYVWETFRNTPGVERNLELFLKLGVFFTRELCSINIWFKKRARCFSFPYDKFFHFVLKIILLLSHSAAMVNLGTFECNIFPSKRQLFRRFGEKQQHNCRWANRTVLYVPGASEHGQFAQLT